MWFHSLSCYSTLGDFLQLYAHLQSVRPVLFDAEMSHRGSLRPSACTRPPPQNIKQKLRQNVSVNDHHSIQSTNSHILPTLAANHLKPQSVNRGVKAQHTVVRWKKTLITQKRLSMFLVLTQPHVLWQLLCVHKLLIWAEAYGTTKCYHQVFWDSGSICRPATLLNSPWRM